jgi:hypothetical protein
VALAQLIAHDRTDGGDVGGLRAGEAGYHVHAHHCHLQESAAQMAHQRVDEAHQAHADAAAFHDQAGEDEEGHGEQDEIAGAASHGLRQHHEGWCVRGPQVARRGKQQDEADRHARANRNEEESERKDNGRVVIERGKPCIPQDCCGDCRRNHGQTRGKGDAPVLVQEVIEGKEREKRHAERQRQRDDRGRRLENGRALAPARSEELDRGHAGESGGEQDEEIGNRKAAALEAQRQAIDKKTHERMIAAPIGDRAAYERQDGKRETRDLVGPQKRVMEIGARKHVREHQDQLAEERRDHKAFGQHFDRAKQGPRRCGRCRSLPYRERFG